MLVRFILDTKALTDDTHSPLAFSLVLLIQLGKNVRFVAVVITCRNIDPVHTKRRLAWQLRKPRGFHYCHQRAKSCRSSSCAFLCCFLAMCRIWLLQTWDEQMQWRWSQSSRMCTFWASSCSPAVWEFKTAHIAILKVNCLCFWDCVRLVTVLYQRSTSNVNMWAFFHIRLWWFNSPPPYIVQHDFVNAPPTTEEPGSELFWGWGQGKN